MLFGVFAVRVVIPLLCAVSFWFLYFSEGPEFGAVNRSIITGNIFKNNTCMYFHM